MTCLRIASSIVGLFATLAATLPVVVAADPNPAADLAERRGCLHCHTPDRPHLGPAFRSVADRYRGDPEAETRLLDWLETGGRGHWGDDYEMSAQEHLGPSDAQTLVLWILRQ